MLLQPHLQGQEWVPDRDTPITLGPSPPGQYDLAEDSTLTAFLGIHNINYYVCQNKYHGGVFPDLVTTYTVPRHGVLRADWKGSSQTALGPPDGAYG